MLLPIIFYFIYLMADVIANICGRCYSHLFWYNVVADVIAK